ncbi:EAL domain-containing protein [Calidifontibacillus oryziterrae]|uniref:EAL domain-containing protein n=1 Tax=Calidifontibacillus oryziterrae TaxID=1191699 RepID=UPI00030A07BB|nr:EAL domain-containing protein [Calidifontibacillus oryziterrae]
MSQSVLNRVIDENLFEHYCQPIFNLRSNEQTGGELLLRTQFGTPDYIFQEAKRNNKLYELDTLSIMNAIHSAAAFNDQLLFLNVFPSTIKNHSFIPFVEGLLENRKINSERIVFELNEAENINDIALLKRGINDLRKMGFLIALDDIGKGEMGLTYIVELNVNFLKLDRQYSKDLAISTKKQDWISALLFYCKLNNIQLILEGIENEETLHIAKQLGIDMGQGFYLGMPEKMSFGYNNIKG